jgi:hypothetical protein
MHCQITVTTYRINVVGKLRPNNHILQTVSLVVSTSYLYLISTNRLILQKKETW